MIRAYITVGIPGSGKSTIAKRIIQEDEFNTIVELNLDDIREELSGDASDQSVTLDAVKLRNERLHHILDNLGDVFISDTNCHADHLWDLMSIIRRKGIEYHHILLIDMDVPVDECLRRNDIRERKVPSDVIYRMSQKQRGLASYTAKLWGTKYCKASQL